MKRFGKICVTFFFIFMLALPVMAGDMGAGGRAGDPPPPDGGSRSRCTGDPEPPGNTGDPEPPGNTGDPEPPGDCRGGDMHAPRAAGTDYSLTLWLTLQSIFIK